MVEGGRLVDVGQQHGLYVLIRVNLNTTPASIFKYPLHSTLTTDLCEAAVPHVVQEHRGLYDLVPVPGLVRHLQYSTVQHSTVQYSTVQYSAVQYLVKTE